LKTNRYDILRPVSLEPIILCNSKWVPDQQQDLDLALLTQEEDVVFQNLLHSRNLCSLFSISILSKIDDENSRDISTKLLRFMLGCGTVPLSSHHENKTVLKENQYFTFISHYY
jgi:hypothetical protein